MGTIANAKVTHYYNCYNGDFIGCLLDFDRRERIAYAEMACYLLFLFGIRTWQSNLVGYGLFVFRGDAFGCRLCFVCRPR